MSKSFKTPKSEWDDDYNDNDNPRRVNKFKKIRESRQQRDLEENLQYENDDDVSKSNITY